MQLTPTVLRLLQRAAGKENVRTDEASLALNAYDCSLSRTRPDAVVFIRRPEDIAPVIGILARHKIPFIPRGAGTNHAGSCAALQGGVVLNLNALNKILHIHTQEGWADVQPGALTGDLQAALAPLGFFYAPDPASEKVCTLGGNLAQNAAGARCMKYGSTADHTLEIDFITPQGEEITLSRTQAGPDLIGLLAGSEGTLGVITRLRVRILPVAKHIKTFLVTFPSLENAVQAVSDLVARGILPRCVEAMDNVTIRAVEGFAHAGYPADAEALLIIELDGSPRQNLQDAHTLEEICRAQHALLFTAAHTQADREKLWRGRRAAFAAMARLAPNVMVGDGTVPRSELPRAVHRIQDILRRYGVTASLLFHAGDGNLHPHLVFDRRNLPQTVQMHQIMREILQACLECEGTLSGEHGIGVEKRFLMTSQYGHDTLALFAQIKNALDPDNLANPSKIIPVDFINKPARTETWCAEELRLAHILKERFEKRAPSVICASPAKADAKALGTERLTEIIRIDKQNFTAAAQAGIPLQTLHDALRRAGVFALFKPQKGTLGGLFSTAQNPDFNRSVLGIKAVLPDGRLIRYGGNFVKNAAGYPLTKLFSGARGRFGAVTELTFKIFAAPQPFSAKTPQEPAPSLLIKRLADALDPYHLLTGDPA